MPDPGVGTVTFLFTDIEGSTALLRRLRGEYHPLLEQHNRLLRDAAARVGGAEVDNQGDSFFFAFPTAGDAVSAAVQAQRAITRGPWPPGAEPRVRMGIHTGEARLHDGRYVGLAVHRAARISAVAHGGQIVLSQATYELLAADEVDLEGVGFRNLGVHALKDFDRPVRMYQAVAPGLVADFPPLREPGSEAEDPKALATRRPPRTAPIRQALARCRRRPVLSIVGAASVLAALAIAAILVSRLELTESAAAVPVQPDSLVGIDPATGAPTSVIDAGDDPGAVVYAGGYVWVLNELGRTITRVDPTTHETTTASTGLEFPCCLAADRDGGVWVSGYGTDGIKRIDPVTLLADRTLAAGSSMHGESPSRLPRLQSLLAAGGGSLWLVDPTGGRVRRISTRTGRVQADRKVDPLPFAIEFADGSSWVSSYGGDSVLEVRAADNVARRIRVPGGPIATTVTTRTLWVNSYSDGSVRRVELTGAAPVTDVVHIGQASGVAARFHDIAYGFGTVWATYGQGAVARIDVEDPGTATRIELGHRAGGLAIGGGRVWVTVQVPIA
jgi:class 3 adenylate cyclase/streptogramin lyase